MKGQIDSSIQRLKLLSNTVPQTSANTFQKSSSSLERFLQLQLDHLVAIPQLKWIEVVFRNSEAPNHKQVIESSQSEFPRSSQTYRYLHSEQWLSSVLSPLSLTPLESVGFGFYACSFTDPDQPPQYLLLCVDGPLSHSCRQLIRRTASCIRDYLSEHHHHQQQSQKVEMLEGIVQRVGHQLQHPLSLISLYAHNLSRLLPEGKLNEQASVIEKTAHGLAQTLTEIMQCARSQDLTMTSQDLRGLVLKTIEDFQGWIAEKDLKITCPDQELYAKFDPLHLKQAISNLLSNAIHFSPQGTEVDIRWHSHQGQTWLTVTDDGPGLSPVDLKKIFKPFYTKRSGGTGLGLSITKKAVQDHGGKLWAKNSPDKGAAFTICLPNVISSPNRLEENTAC